MIVLARKVTKEDITLINETYLKLKTYAATARATGFSAGTVKKYIIEGYVSKENLKARPCKGIPSKEEFKMSWNIELIDEEIKEIEELWEEISV